MKKQYADGGLMSLEEAKDSGRYGDSILVHMNPAELDPLTTTINPKTGLPEQFLPFVLPVLGGIAGSTLASSLALGTLGTAGLTGLGSAVGTGAAGGDMEDMLLSGLTSFGLSGMMEGASDFGANEALQATAPMPVNPAQAAAGSSALNLAPNVAGPGGIASVGNVAPSVAGPSMAGVAPTAAGQVSPLAQKVAAAASAPTGEGIAGISSQMGIGDRIDAIRYGFDSDAVGMAKHAVTDNLMYPAAGAVGALGLYDKASRPDYSDYWESRLDDGEDIPEQFPTGREYIAPSEEYRPGFDEEHVYFNPVLDSPRGYADGGIVTTGQDQMSAGQAQIVIEARRALETDDHPDPASAISRFIEAFGPEAFQILRQQTNVANAERAQGGEGYARGGLVEGPGTERSDSIPARVNGHREVQLSDGEFIVPADVVRDIGGGSREQGAMGLQGLINSVRSA